MYSFLCQLKIDLCVCLYVEWNLGAEICGFFIYLFFDFLVISKYYLSVTFFVIVKEKTTNDIFHPQNVILASPVIKYISFSAPLCSSFLISSTS